LGQLGGKLGHLSERFTDDGFSGFGHFDNSPSG
jgi:hypothetical protein